MAGPPNAQEDNYKRIVKSYVGEKLRKKGLKIRGYEGEELKPPVIEIAKTLQRVGDELESANTDFFKNMCDQLQITPSTAYPTFQSIADEIFVSGKNWGRVVAFLTFGGNFAVHCALRADMGEEYVDRVVNWISKYMAVNLDYWINQQGGWDGFLIFFEKTKNNDDEQGSQSVFLVSALAGLGVGALLMLTFK
ncbi:bcl-2-like protein 1-like [Hydra vulgaris]|uniref:Bcl-2-like protein 1-like n=1 Tax=Hydra vulgaris TaxID=6087 RepID=A7LM80_HYDVU|nr:bcl-2-like protein 1-like [Hydra vulgaris]ABS84173.1 bcl-2-like 4 [Hydra vulgaris]